MCSFVSKKFITTDYLQQCHRKHKNTVIHQLSILCRSSIYLTEWKMV
ncbi:Hypothetical protein ETEE_0985 [Edwardsiella anguillarum ET080813]|uniref:Uncharacterized protein n=1 Tax=Edwardsiella anguillarum ET080813 TaxID=667120 RepID=A0A076LG00_9GAMM|nr:Hypothetical protein ETEE_0985 [Edwardsiella anguillarum ET080813]